MAILPILQFPDPRLQTKAARVDRVDDEIKKIVDDMYETMYEHRGLGLAATQVNIHQQIFVMDVSEERDKKICVINPEVISQSGTQIDYHGCLSVGAGVSDKIKRAAKIKIRGMDLSGKSFELEGDGVMAICIQHEMDHLNGKLFINHLSQLKQERIRKKIDKFKKLSE